MQKTEFARMLNLGLGVVGVQMELREGSINSHLSEFFDRSNCPYSEYTIGGWRKGGHQPEQPHKIADLVVRFCKEHDRYGMVTPTWAKRILKLANHPKYEDLLIELFPTPNSRDQVSVTIETMNHNERFLALMSDSMNAYLHKTFQAIHKRLQSYTVEQSKSYFSHVGRMLEYLHHFVALLPVGKELNERECAVLVTATYLFRLSRYFLYQLDLEHNIDLLMYEFESRETVEQANLEYDLFIGWVEEFLQQEHYSSLQWTKREFAEQIATVCQGALLLELSENDRYSASGNGEYLVRPALLLALLSLADMLASAKSKPNRQALEQLEESDAKRRVAAWLRFYLQDIKVQDGHIRYHYLLPPQEEYIAVQVLLSLPLQLHLRRMRDILTRHRLMIFADSTIEHGNREPMPPILLQAAQRIANEWINKHIPTILGTTSDFPTPQAIYQYSGLPNLPVWSWDGEVNAEKYQCQLYHIDTAQRIATWETTALESTVQTDQVTSNEKYEWLVYAYAGKQRLREQNAGMFWLNKPALRTWPDNPTLFFPSVDTADQKLIQARLYQSNEFYSEASQFYAEVIATGNIHQQLQAKQELMLLYEEIAQQLSQYKRFRRADLYRAAAAAIAQQLNCMVSEQ